MDNAEKIDIFPTVGLQPLSHFVYLIRVSFLDDTMFKIGITNNIKARMSALRSEGYNPEIIAHLNTSCARKIERELHDQLIEYHHSFTYQNNYPKWSYEFFDFNKEQLERVIQIIRSYDPERFILVSYYPFFWLI